MISIVATPIAKVDELQSTVKELSAKKESAHKDEDSETVPHSLKKKWRDQQGNKE